MSIILKMAWRNIWRNRLRSSVVICSVVVGIWALVFLNAWMRGMINGYVQNAIKNEVSHIQIHHPAFIADKEAKYFIENTDSLIDKLKNLPGIESISSRTILNGMLAAARGNIGVRIIGIEPISEAKTTGLDKKIEKGSYFQNIQTKKVPILVSEKTAERLKLTLKSNVSLQFQTLEGDSRIGCKVIGIYRGINSRTDLITVFMPQHELNKTFSGSSTADSSITAFSDISHEIAIMLKSTEQLNETKLRIKEFALPYKTEDYKEIAPDTALMESFIEMGLWVIIWIVMFALVFGIINTMLMAVLERYRELGMLMSIGMGRVSVFMMIVTETLILSVVGAPLGMLLGRITVFITHKQGISLSAYSEAMRQYGLTELIRPETDTAIYWKVSIAIVLTAIIGAIYPAYRAVILRPADAIRKI
jgi:putative ABC transport system permease protein